jgi:hypothetical protein
MTARLAGICSMPVSINIHTSDDLAKNDTPTHTYLVGLRVLDDSWSGGLAVLSFF